MPPPAPKTSTPCSRMCFRRFEDREQTATIAHPTKLLIDVQSPTANRREAFINSSGMTSMPPALKESIVPAPTALPHEIR